MKRKRFNWFDLLIKVSVVVGLVAIIVLGIWLRNTIPCDWMPLKEAPPRCLTGVVR